STAAVATIKWLLGHLEPRQARHSTQALAAASRAARLIKVSVTNSPGVTPKATERGSPTSVSNATTLTVGPAAAAVTIQCAHRAWRGLRNNITSNATSETSKPPPIAAR